jgi:hypothetical protein
MPETLADEEIYRTVHNDLEVISQKILVDIENNLKKAVKLWNTKKKKLK